MKNLIEYVGKHKMKPPSIPPKGGGHIIDSFALSSFGGVGGGYSFSSFFTPLGNKSHIPVFPLFHQKRMLYEGWFYVYIYNVQRAEDRNREVRVHTCR